MLEPSKRACFLTVWTNCLQIALRRTMQIKIRFLNYFKFLASVSLMLEIQKYLDKLIEEIALCTTGMSGSGRFYTQIQM